MSAFIVSDNTLQQIVRFLDLDVRFSNTARCSYGYFNRLLLKHGFNLELKEHRDKLIKEMALLNRLGVNERYNENEVEEDVSYIEGMPPSLIQTYKSLSCFLYQCSEGDIPETNDLFKMFEDIKNQMACAIVNNLKEYETAKWDV